MTDIVERLRTGVYGLNRIGLCNEAAAEITRLQLEIDRRFGIGGELIVARRDRDEALHKQRIAEQALERLVRRCEAEMADTIDVSEIQTAKALLGLGA